MNSITHKPLSDTERREIARTEMQSYSDKGLFRYVLITPHIRHLRQPDGTMLHSLVDVINLLWDVKHDDADSFEARIQWQNTKRRIKRDDLQLYQNLIQLKIPSWNDGKLYKTDLMNTGWLFWFIPHIQSKLSGKIRTAFADELNHYDREHHAAIIMELERKEGWAGTRNRLLVQETYEPGDYDNPVVPPGSFYER